MRHIQRVDLRQLVVVDAENVRRSTWPNLSKEELGGGSFLRELEAVRP